MLLLSFFRCLSRCHCLCFFLCLTAVTRDADTQLQQTGQAGASVWFWCWSWGPQIKPLEGDLRRFLGYQVPNTRERSKSPEKAIYGSSRSIWYPHSREQKEAHRTPFTAQSSTNKRRLTQAQKASQRTTSMNSGRPISMKNDIPLIIIP